jgi:glycosyltransferase involved in cell wall biosynthesis
VQSWTNFTWWLTALVCFVYKIPLVFMTDSNILGETSKSKIKLLFKHLVLGKFLFKNASGFLTSGTANEEFYRYYKVPNKKIIRMPFSWGYESFLDESEKIKDRRQETRQKMQLALHDFVILYVGRFSEEKSPMLLLQAYHMVNSSRKKLFLVGDGPMRKDLEDYVKNHAVSGVEFFGFQPKESLFHFYNIADVLVMPSKRETWGIVVNEAMCFGLPIIASDKIGVAVDLVKHEQNGLIFPTENSQALARAIETMMSLPPKDLARLGRASKAMIEHWVASYHPSEQLKKLLTLIPSKK